MMILAAILLYFWRKRIRDTEKPKLNSGFSKLIGSSFGLLMSAIGVLWFLEFSGILSSVGPGASREHFIGVVGIIFGTIFTLFGLGVFFVSLVSVRSIENWAAKEHEDIQLW